MTMSASHQSRPDETGLSREDPGASSSLPLPHLRPYSAEWYAAVRAILGDGGCKQLGYYEIRADFLLSVVVPIYNEEANIRRVVDRVRAVPIRKEIVLVDDHSSDDSVAVITQLLADMKDDPQNQVRAIFHERNRGKGAALRTGFDDTSGDIIIVQDADLEYYPEEYFLMAEPILDGRADVVYGTRFLGTHRVFLYWHYVGNRFLTWVTNILYNTMLSDMETCFKMCRGEIFRSLRLEANRFGFEPEFTAKVFKKGYKVYEVPISYNGRGYEEGKKITWRDGVAALWFLLKFRFGD